MCDHLQRLNNNNDNTATDSAGDYNHLFNYAADLRKDGQLPVQDIQKLESLGFCRWHPSDQDSLSSPLSSSLNCDDNVCTFHFIFCIHNFLNFQTKSISHRLHFIHTLIIATKATKSSSVATKSSSVTTKSSSVTTSMNNSSPSTSLKNSPSTSTYSSKNASANNNGENSISQQFPNILPTLNIPSFLPKINYYDTQFKSGTLAELQQRTIPELQLHAVVQLYAFSLFGITQVLASGGGCSNHKLFYCKSCHNDKGNLGSSSIMGVKFELVGSKTPSLDRTKNMYKWAQDQLINGWENAHKRARSFCPPTCGHHKELTNHVVINHPKLLPLFIEKFTDDPQHAMCLQKKSEKKKDLIKTFFDQLPPYSYKSKNVGDSVYDALVRYLHSTELSSASTYNLLPLWLSKFLHVNKSKDVSVALQCDVSNRFLRLFVGLPIARHIGTLTAPIIVGDAHHYKTVSFDGRLYAITSKDGYGKTVLLSLTIIPEENVRHIGWTVEMNLRHGINFNKIPFMTDEGHLLATALAFQHEGNNHQHKHRRLVHLNINICNVHFVRTCNTIKSLKRHSDTTHHMIHQMSRSSDQNEFFTIFRTAIVKLSETISDTSHNLPFSDIAKLGLKVLAVHPEHWTLFANLPQFNDKQYEIERSKVIDTLLCLESLWEEEVTKPPDVASTAQSIPTFQDQERLVDAVEQVLQIPNRHAYKNILRKKGKHPSCFVLNGNMVEGFNNGCLEIGSRNKVPLYSLQLVLNYASSQDRALLRNYSKQYPSAPSQQVCPLQKTTSIGQNVMEVMQSNLFDPSSTQESNVCRGGAPRLTSSERSILQENDFNKKMGVPLDVQLFKTTLTLEEANGIQQWNITLSHGFPKRPYIRMQCDRHNVFNFHLNCPCPCFRFIFSLMKKKKGLPPQGGSPFWIDDLMPDSPTLTEKAFSGLIPEWMAVDQVQHYTEKNHVFDALYQPFFFIIRFVFCQ